MTVAAEDLQALSWQTRALLTKLSPWAAQAPGELQPAWTEHLERLTKLDSALAVKVLLRPQSLEDQQRFLQEAKLASVVSHPSTVQIVDFGVLPRG